MRQTSLASPLPVLAESSTLSWSKRHRTGLFSLSEITTLTRSMLSIRALVSAITVMGFFRGMAFL